MTAYITLIAALLLLALSSLSLTKALALGWVQGGYDRSAWGKDPAGPFTSSSPNSLQISLGTSNAAT